MFKRMLDGCRRVIIITSAGISAGVDMSLFLVSKIRSQDLAIRTAKQMDFDWKKNT